MRFNLKGMREDIEGERGKKSIENYALSHGWPSGNTGVSICSGNMTASDAPEGRPGKSVKGPVNVKGYRVWASEKTCICMLYLSVFSLHTKAKL